jgi:hypothetical protein
MREIRPSGSVEHTAHLVTPVPVPEEFPKIGLPALLRLIDWLRARRQEPQSGGLPCIQTQQSLSPPAPTLGTLCGDFASHLADASCRKPGTHPKRPQQDRGPAPEAASERVGGEA